MCLYPKRIKNLKYQATKKNEYISPALMPDGYPFIGHTVPICEDERCLTVEIPCGQCYECRKQIANDWRARINEEWREHKYNYFVTLTFSPEELEILHRNTHLGECNALATKAVRRSLERYRKDHKHSLKHWYITELGHEGTERIHLHGLIFADEPLQFGEPDEHQMREWKYWRYGKVFIGDYVNSKTCNYIVKYMTKIDTDHKGFIGKVHASPGIGKIWIQRHLSDPTYKYVPGNTRTDYVLNNGCRTKLPTYWKNHIYSEEERELIWRDFMDKDKCSILGIEHSNKIGNKSLSNITNKAQEVNSFLGYGSDSKEWKKKDYNITEKMITKEENRKRAREELSARIKLITALQIGEMQEN